MDQFNSNYFQFKLAFNVEISKYMYVCVKTTKISIHSQITNWAENEWLLVNNMNLLGIPKIHQLML